MTAVGADVSRLTDALRGWIGRQAVYVAPEPVGEASIRYFELAIGGAPTASPASAGALTALPTFVCETNQFYVRDADASGYFGHDWGLPVETRGVVRGGNEYEFFEPVRPDDRITVTWTLVELFERATRTGPPLLFVISEARYVNQHGVLLAINRETNILR